MNWHESSLCENPNLPGATGAPSGTAWRPFFWTGREDTGIIERYIEKFQDPTPALFWAARFCQDSKTLQEQALAQIPEVMGHLNALLEAAKGGKRNA